MTIRMEANWFMKRISRRLRSDSSGPVPNLYSLSHALLQAVNQRYDRGGSCIKTNEVRPPYYSGGKSQFFSPDPMAWFFTKKFQLSDNHSQYLLNKARNCIDPSIGGISWKGSCWMQEMLFLTLYQKASENYELEQNTILQGRRAPMFHMPMGMDCMAVKHGE